MKKTLLLFTFMLSITFLSAQSLEFVYNGEALANNAKITVTEFTADPDFGDEMEFDADIRNKTGSLLRLTLYKEELEVPANSENDFCNMINCYTGSASSEYELEAYGVDNQFAGSYRPQEKSTAKIKYRAVVSNSLGDETSVEVTYAYLTAGIDKVGLDKFSLLQTNGRAILNFSSSETLDLRVVNMTGATIEMHRLQPGSGTLNLGPSVRKGIYFLVFNTSSGVRHTEKVIIK